MFALSILLLSFKRATAITQTEEGKQILCSPDKPKPFAQPPADLKVHLCVLGVGPHVNDSHTDTQTKLICPDSVGKMHNTW